MKKESKTTKIAFFIIIFVFITVVINNLIIYTLEPSSIEMTHNIYEARPDTPSDDTSELKESLGSLPLIDNSGSSSNDGSLLKANNLPSKYDGRTENYNKYITVKNQKLSGMCWAYAACSAAERCFLKERQDSSLNLSKISFSPDHLAYFLINHVPDKLGNTVNDYTSFENTKTYFNAGGNEEMTIQGLSQWKGFADGGIMPYIGTAYKPGDIATFDKYKVSYAYQDKAIIENGIKLHTSDDIKRAIMEHGAVVVSYNASAGKMQDNYHAYYTSSRVAANHEVCIIGWDDNFSISKFPCCPVPSNNGAWICQNSWGPNWQDKGYFYLSYEDKSIDGYCCYDVQDSNIYDYNYHYDGNAYDLGVYYNGNNGTHYANEYEVKICNQCLKAIGITTYTDNYGSEKFGVKIYTDIKNPENPYSGNLAADFISTVPHASGFNTIEIPSSKKIMLTKGSRFAVVIESNSKYGDMCLSKTTTDTYAKYVNYCEPNQSFVGTSKSLKDLYYDPNYKTACFKIKAFTIESSDARLYPLRTPPTNYRIEVIKPGAPNENESANILNMFHAANNALMPAGCKYSIDDEGNCTLTYPDGTSNTMSYELLTVKKIMLADKNAPKLPAENQRVNAINPNNLTESERSQVLNLIEKTNRSILPSGVVYSINENNKVVIKYSDASEDEISISGLIKNKLRLAGSTRYETSRAIATELRRQRGSKFSSIILAYGENFPDALGAGPLAKAYDAPVIMVNQAQETKVIKYVQDNIAERGFVFLLGSTGVISQDFASRLNKISQVSRVVRFGGKDRFETNMKILNSLSTTGGKILICNGDNFPDSLSASATGYPIMIVRRNLTSSQLQFVRRHKTDKYYLIGGPAVVSNTISSQIYSIIGSNPKRIYGSDRLETSNAVAKEFFSKTTDMVMTYAYNFPDGLSGGPLCQKLGCPLVLSDGYNSNAKSAYNSISAARLFMLGGASLISDNFAKKIAG